jgi:hypothetical protein
MNTKKTIFTEKREKLFSDYITKLSKSLSAHDLRNSYEYFESVYKDIERAIYTFYSNARTHIICFHKNSEADGYVEFIISIYSKTQMKEYKLIIMDGGEV